MSSKTLISVQEFEALSESEEFRYELDEGELIEMPKPRPRRNMTSSELALEMGIYLRGNPVGRVITGENLCVLGPETRRIPDLVFYRAERLARLDRDEELQGAPDLAVEVVSPSDRTQYLHRKIRQYFDAGASEVWVIDPGNQFAEIWKGPFRIVRTLGPDDFLTTELMPGFSVRLGALFV